jgi:hypothetical protein
VETKEQDQTIAEIKPERLKLRDAVEFVLEHRGDTGVFRPMTPKQIMDEIIECGKEGGVFSVTEQGRLTGLATLEINESFNHIYVHNMLCITPKATLAMCHFYAHFFWGWEIQAYRDLERKHLVRYERSTSLVRRLAFKSYLKQT